MISVYQLKPKFQNLLRPIVKKLYSLNVTANQVTILAMLLSMIIGFTVWYFSYNSFIYLILPVFLFIRMALNAIDGILAKEFGQKSKLGGILNELGDIYSDTAIFLGLWNIVCNHLVFILLIVFSIISETAGILGAVVGNGRRYDGPMGKSDRAFVISCLSILLAFKIINEKIVNIIFIIMIILLNYTIFNRIKNCLKESD